MAFALPPALSVALLTMGAISLRDQIWRCARYTEAWLSLMRSLVRSMGLLVFLEVCTKPLMECFVLHFLLP